MAKPDREQAREWQLSHNVIPKERCGYRISQTVEKCHEYQRLRGRCPFKCKYRLRSVGKRKAGYSKFNQRGVQLEDDGE